MPKHVSHCRRHAIPIWASMHACSLYRATARLPISCRSREMYCPNGDKQRSGRYAGPAQFGHSRQKFTLRQDVRHCQSVGGTKPEACSYDQGEPRSKKAAASPDSENRSGSRHMVSTYCCCQLKSLQHFDRSAMQGKEASVVHNSECSMRYSKLFMFVKEGLLRSPLNVL